MLVPQQTPENMGGGGLAEMWGRLSKMIANPEVPAFGYQCTATNYTEGPLIDLALEFVLTF